MAALQNSLKMHFTLLILTAIAISTATVDSSKFIANRQQQTALSIQTIVHRYFTRGRTVLVSMPSDEQHTGRSLSPPPYDNNRALVSFTLTNFHDKMSVTLVFRKTILSTLLEDVLHEIGNLASGKSDIVIGPVPLAPLVVSLTF
jgi:hypothetical protein